MTDPVEPPEVAMWKQEWRISASVLLAAQRERDEARRLLEAALLDLEVDAPNGAYMPGELPDQIRTYLGSTSGGFHTEEPKP